MTINQFLKKEEKRRQINLLSRRILVPAVQLMGSTPFRGEKGRAQLASTRKKNLLVGLGSKNSSHRVQEAKAPRMVETKSKSHLEKFQQISTSRSHLFFSKKADLALNLIIVAIIALLVLVVVIYLFTGKSQIFSKGLAGCSEKGGKCSTELKTSCPTGTITIAKETSDCGKGIACCKSFDI